MAVAVVVFVVACAAAATDKKKRDIEFTRPHHPKRARDRSLLVPCVHLQEDATKPIPPLFKHEHK